MNICFCAGVQADIVISKKQPVSLILPEQAIASEEMAAKELQHYLTQITQTNCQIVRENAEQPKRNIHIYVGPTRFAKQQNAKSTFTDQEEWCYQISENDIIITGGRPRGTLYGAYHFLEEVCGVRWWTMNEESVPARDEIRITSQRRQGKPAFQYRDIFRDPWNGAIRDNGRFMARQRRNREGEFPVSAAYGGANDYGPPAFTHTVMMYIKPEIYFAKHPDWFALVNGKRVQDGQLDYTNPEMRAEFLRLLLANIRDSRAAALAKGLPAPHIFAVAQADNNNWCQCDRCNTLVKREGSESGPMVDFVNYLAQNTQREFPYVSLITLAYARSEEPPKTIRPLGNVIIFLTDTTSNLLEPVTAPRNSKFRENIQRWAIISKQLRIWDYNETYGILGLPMPTLDTYAADLQFFRKNHVEGVFAQMQEPVQADMRELKTWVLSKLLEDPQQDTHALVREFTNGYYGAAGPFIRRYLDALNEAVRERAAGQGMPDVTWYAGLAQHSYLTLDFIKRVEAIFDKAAETVKNDELLSRRVRIARMPLDEAAALNAEKLMREWTQAGHSSETFPLQREVLLARYAQAWKEQINQTITPDQRQKYFSGVAEQQKLLQAIIPEAKLPEQFKDVSSANIYTYNAFDARAPKKRDMESPNGVTLYKNFSAEELQDLKEISFGCYDQLQPGTFFTANLALSDMADPGYHLYHLGMITPTANCEVYAHGMEVDIGNAFDKRHPDQKFDLWVSLKREGTALCWNSTLLVKRSE